jgi:hypothetical protein
VSPLTGWSGVDPLLREILVDPREERHPTGVGALGYRSFLL